MNPYHNLYYTFSQKENQATKALLNTLEYLDSSYTMLFLKEVTKSDVPHDEFAYTLQGVLKHRDFENPTSKNYLLCIAESTYVEQDKSDLIDSLPDGGIFSKGHSHSINVVIETKINDNNLCQDQLERHLELFGSNEAR